MLGYDGNNPGRQLIGSSEFNTLFDVIGQNERRHAWAQAVMAIAHVGLVLDKVGGAKHLSDVVIITSDAGKQGIGAYGLRGSFSKEPDHYRMVVSAWSTLSQLPEERQIEVGKLEEFDIRGYPERPFENRQQNRRNHRGQQPADKAAEGIECQDRKPGLIGSQEVERQR